MKHLKKFDAINESNGYYKLKGGEVITAKEDMHGHNDSYNMPATIDIPKGTSVIVPSEATRMGDLFTTLNIEVEGNPPVEHSRYEEGKIIPLKNGARIGLSSRSGYEMGGGPHILGSIDLDKWDIMGNLHEGLVNESKYSDAEYDYTGFTKDITLESVKNAIHEGLQLKAKYSSHFSHQLEHGANADLNMDVEKLAQRIMHGFHDTLSYITERYEGELEDIINGDFK